MAQETAAQKPDQLPWDPNSAAFPSRSQLPKIPDAPEDAAWVWGKDDFLGRLNLLTATRVLNAMKEARLGEVIPVKQVSSSEDEPQTFKREAFKHEITTLVPSYAYDDVYHLNTQSGTQWDGFRHFAHRSGKFYNGTTGDDIVGPNANQNCSIHYWAEHGIAGRGVLLDYYEYAQKMGKHFDPYQTCKISYQDLFNCGKAQGLDIRPKSQGGDIMIGDILFVRSGWFQAYSKQSEETKANHSEKEHNETFGGLAQETAILDWLHDCYFAAVAGDAPSFEAWPTSEAYHLHEYILSLWGMPLGEMLQLERLAQRCHELNRFTFFFTSMPGNCPNGVGSHVNGMAIL